MMKQAVGPNGYVWASSLFLFIIFLSVLLRDAAEHDSYRPHFNKTYYYFIFTVLLHTRLHCTKTIIYYVRSKVSMEILAAVFQDTHLNNPIMVTLAGFLRWCPSWDPIYFSGRVCLHFDSM